MKLVSYPHIGAQKGSVDNDRKRWWPTQWKTKVPAIVSNFFPGFICHIIKEKSIS